MLRREPLAPAPSPIRAHFEARFLEAYGLHYLFLGDEDCYWRDLPGRPNFPVPSFSVNRHAVGKLEALAHGDVEEACRRIDRLFANPVMRDLGIHLDLVSTYWRELGTANGLSLRLRAIDASGRRAGAA